jgi:hypothetical protein
VPPRSARLLNEQCALGSWDGWSKEKKAGTPNPSSDPSQALQPKNTLPGNLRTERGAAPLSATLE